MPQLWQPASTPSSRAGEKTTWVIPVESSSEQCTSPQENIYTVIGQYPMAPMSARMSLKKGTAMASTVTTTTFHDRGENAASDHSNCNFHFRYYFSKNLIVRACSLAPEKKTNCINQACNYLMTSQIPDFILPYWRFIKFNSTYYWLVIESR